MTRSIFSLKQSYLNLPESFYQKQFPTKVSSPKWIQFNKKLAKELELNISESTSDEALSFFAGNNIPENLSPIAQAYAGHQFGHFVPQLGDGRAVLLGELESKENKLFDVQLKGAGQTKFSRNGDGRAAIGPVVREYIVSEAMHALGIKTTRALAAVITGEKVQRETALPGAILTRVAASHIRVGTFEYFAAKGDIEAIRKLADYVINRHYNFIKDEKNPYLSLLQEVMKAQAKLVASWMGVGFIHGVMNTDNTSIAGETIDYGPCAFLDEYDPQKTFSSIDRNGRYAYNNQGYIAQWNMARFAETLLPILDEDFDKAVAIAENEIVSFKDLFENEWRVVMCAKLGLQTIQKDDVLLVQEFLELMQRNKVDFTNSFRLLTHAINDANNAFINLEELFSSEKEEFNHWFSKWQRRLQNENIKIDEVAEFMKQKNPAFIPRNHQIEKVIKAAEKDLRYDEMEQLMKVLESPYQEQDENKNYMIPPSQEEKIKHTFCGT